jgi:hypothetical protein
VLLEPFGPLNERDAEAAFSEQIGTLLEQGRGSADPGNIQRLARNVDRYSCRPEQSAICRS